MKIYKDVDHKEGRRGEMGLQILYERPLQPRRLRMRRTPRVETPCIMAWTLSAQEKRRRKASAAIGRSL